MSADDVVSNDPDGLKPCYSDHAEDIRVLGACTMCGSGEVNVVGHILPAVPRVTGLDPVAASELVLSDMTARMVDGVLLDTFSASAVVAIDKALQEPTAKEKLRQMSLVKAVEVCFRLLINHS